MAKDIVQRISLQGAEEIRRQFQDVARAGSDAFSQIEKAGARDAFGKVADSANRLGGQLREVGTAGQAAGQQIQESFAGVNGRLDNAGESAAGFGTRFVTATAAIVAGAVAIGAAFNAAITKMVESGATAASKLQESADKLGVTTSKLQELRNQVETAGASASAFESALGRLGNAASNAGTQTAQAAEKVSGWVVRTVDGQRAAGSLAAAVEALGKGITRTSYEVDGSTIKVTRFGQETKKAAEAAQGAAGVLQQLGINLQRFSTANADERLTMLRQAFARLPDDASRAAAAAKLFGENWREMLKVVTMTPEQIAAANKALEDSGRKMTQAEIDNLTAYKTAKADLDASLEATRNKIAAIFAPGKTRTAEWLTELIDTNRQWLLDLAQTKKEQIETFFSERFGSGRAALTYMLEQASQLAQELGRVLTSVVVPAVRLVQGAFEFAAGKINALFGTQITGRFLAVAAAVASFTGVLGGLRVIGGAVISVVGLIVGAIAGLRGALVTGGLGAAAFWTQLRAGALAAFNAIRGSIPALREALSALLRGDLRTAWQIIQREGVAAFEAIKKVLLDTRTPIGQMFQSLRTGFNLVMGALNAFAQIINAVFGTKLTGASLAFYTALLQISGVLGTVIPIIGGLALVLSRLGVGFVAIAAAGVIVYRLFGQLSVAWEKLTAGFSSLLSGDFAKGWEQLKEAASSFWSTLTDQSALTWAILIAGAGVAVAKIVGLFVGIGPALMGLVGVIGSISGLLVSAFTGLVTLLAGLVTWPALLVAAVAVAVAAIIAFWPEISAAFVAAWQAMVDFASTVWQSIVSAASSAWDAIKASAEGLWTAIRDGATGAWETVVSGFRSAWEGLVGALRGLWDSFASYVTSAIQGLSSTVNSIVSTISSAISSIMSAISSAASAAASIVSGGGGETEGFAGGGLIRGPGTGTSDSIFARLSNGEFVIREAAVRYFGPAFFAALNSLRVPKFATGGLVGAMAMPGMGAAPAFAGAGGGSLAPVTLNIGGQTFSGLLAPQDVIGEISDFAARQQLLSTGRAPGWQGGRS